MRKGKLLLGILLALMALLTATRTMAQSQITMTTKQTTGKMISLGITANGDFVVEGATLDSGTIYTITDSEGRITIKGDVTVLRCTANKLTQLDVSQNPKLQKLYCEGNQLTQLDVSKSPNLKTLRCTANKLTQLDVSQNPKLQKLYCEGNQLTQLDVRQNRNLQTLHCENNQLAQLDVSKNPNLKALRCQFNYLTQLDVSKNPNLETLHCYKNKIKNKAISDLVATLPDRSAKEMKGRFVVVSKIKKKEYPGDNVCTKAQVEEALKKGWNPEYSYILRRKTHYASYEGLTLQISLTTQKKVNEIITLDIRANDEFSVEGATHVDNRDYKITDPEGKITIKGDVHFLYAKEQGVTELDVKEAPSLTHLGCWENALTQLDVSQNSELQKLSCSSNQLSELDVSQNPKLQELFCYSNQLSELNVNQNPELQQLSCYNNRLSKLNVSQSPELQKLSCDDNQLSELNVSQNPKLQELRCSNNQLSELNVSQSPKLQKLFCDNNQLSELDVTQNINLTILNCSRNRIKNMQMDALITSLPDRGGKAGIGEFFVIDHHKGDENNLCTATQVTAVRNKGWIARKFENGEWIECDKEETPPTDNNIITLTTSKHKGETILLFFSPETGVNIIGATPTGNPYEYTINDESGKISLHGPINFFNCSAILDLKRGNIMSIASPSHKGMRDDEPEPEPEPEEPILIFESNQITELDVSKNPLLEVLICTNNQLTQLDLSQNTNLRALGCFSNQIKGEQMNALIASLPDRSQEDDKGIFVVISTFDTNEGNVCTKKQVAAANKQGWRALCSPDANDANFAPYEGSEDVAIDEVLAEGEATIVAIYNINGHLLSDLQEGVNIIRLSNGETRKLLVTQSKDIPTSISIRKSKE